MTQPANPTLYTTATAAAYLGLHEQTLKYHIYEKAHIKPDYELGGSLAFTQATLDAFKATHQSDGLTMKEAAVYLGLSLSTIRYHVYASKRLAPDGKRGRERTLSRAVLDALIAAPTPTP